MKTYLDRILYHKRGEVNLMVERITADSDHPFVRLLRDGSGGAEGSFEKALGAGGLSVVAEVKRRSPSKGEIDEIPDPVELAGRYREGGAAAVSVLTDETFFGGSLEDLRKVAALGAEGEAFPALRKDFILHPLQVAEAAETGASAVLLIVAALGSGLRTLIEAADYIGLDALVEVHGEEELETAVEAGARIVGVNSRDLTTFNVDLSVAEALRPKIPGSLATVAESGIQTPADAHRMREAGYDAVLVGEALVRADDPAALIRQMKQA